MGLEILLSEALPNLSKLQHLGIDYCISLEWERLGSLCELETFSGRFYTVHI